MGFIKRYAALLLPAGLVILAIVLFFLSERINSSVQKEMLQSTSTAGRIQSLAKKAVPSSQWEVAAEYQRQHSEDVNSINQIATGTNKRELLSYQLFHDPNRATILFFKDFAADYVSSVENLFKEINSRDCPTSREVEELLSGEKGGGGRDRANDGKNAEITESYYKMRADSISVYGNPLDVEGYKFWKANKYGYVGNEEWINACWYTQLAYWVQSDVIKSIGALNAGSEKVYNSPVKRLLGISFSNSDGVTTTDKAPRPQYVQEDSGVLADAWTSRKCDDEIDVVHFSAAVVVRADSDMAFMRELCSAKEHVFRGYRGDEPEQRFAHNQITVLEYSREPLNREDKTHERYRYGDDAVVQLNLICEYVFNRSGYDSIKPKEVKQELGQLKKPKAEKKPRKTSTKKK